MRARVWLAAFGAIVLASSACADLFGFRDLTEGDSGADVVVQPDTGADVDTCPHTHWPDPPASGSGTSVAYTLAMHHVYFTTTPDGGAATFGYDLDNRCTVDPASVSCKAANVTIDGVGGVDNGSIGLMSTVVGLGVTDSLKDDSINAVINSGAFTMLVRIFNLQNDTNQAAGSISVALQASPSIVSSPPNWVDGGDRWYPAFDDVVGGDAGTNTPNHLMPGYVTNGVLVATDTNKNPLTLALYLPPGNTPTGPLHVKLIDPVITARLVKRADGNYDLADGVIAGRWAASDMLRAVADLTINGSSLCTYIGGAAYTEVLGKICNARDITSDNVDDDTEACDSLSVAVGFDAVSAQVGSTPVAFPVSTTPCGDAALCGD